MRIIDVRPQIQNLRIIIGFTTEQIATIFNVRKETVYNWACSGYMNVKCRLKLEALRGYVTKWKNHKLPKVNGEWYKRIEPKNQSLINMLSENPINNDMVIELIKKMVEKFIEIRSKYFNKNTKLNNNNKILEI